MSVCLCCTSLYFTVLHFTSLYFTVLHCTVLSCTFLYLTVLHCSSLHCWAEWWCFLVLYLVARGQPAIVNALEWLRQSAPLAFCSQFKEGPQGTYGVKVRAAFYQYSVHAAVKCTGPSACDRKGTISRPLLKTVSSQDFQTLRLDCHVTGGWLEGFSSELRLLCLKSD